MVNLRRAVEADVVTLHELATLAFGKYVPRIGAKPAPIFADYAALVASGHVWVAGEATVDQIAGFVVLVPAADQLHLDIIAVRPGLQRQGVGARLMVLAEEEAVRQGLPAVTLYTNEAMTENLEYYPRWGYDLIQRAEHEGFRRVFFRKNLGEITATEEQPMRRYTSIEAFAQAEGDVMGPGEWVEVRQAAVDQFAEATGDQQWIHVDPERAEDGPFGGTIAHGYFTLSLLPALLGQLYRVDGVKVAINYGLNRVRFPAPVPVGARVRLSAVLTGARLGEGFVESVVTATIAVEGSAKPGCVAQTVSRLYR